MRSYPVTVVSALLVACMAHTATASEYIGLWRFDEAAPGISVTFPDNGFDGACLSFSNGGGDAGEVQLESQINRHRFSTLSLVASGQLDPAIVHVQLSVKGKTAWGATDYDFAEQPVMLQLEGYEVTIAAKELAASEDQWTVTLCSLEFSNPQYSLRFTSDCAGYDFVAGDSSLRLIADEDWLALKRDMVGGMGLFRLSSGWADSELDLTCQTTFPDQLFFSALAVDDMPVLQPDVGVPGTMTFIPGTPGEHALVVKTKGPVVGNAEWRTSLSWKAPPPPPATVDSADLVGGDSLSAEDAQDGFDGPVDGEVNKDSGSGSCRASDGSSRPVLAFLLALLVLLRYHAARSRKVRLRTRFRECG